MHQSTFEYLQPSEKQIETMARVRKAFADLHPVLNLYLPDGEDKNHVFRLVRDAAMWANVSITREDDGTPRS
jgi:hypothetical protein